MLSWVRAILVCNDVDEAQFSIQSCWTKPPHAMGIQSYGFSSLNISILSLMSMPGDSIVFRDTITIWVVLQAVSCRRPQKSSHCQRPRGLLLASRAALRTFQSLMATPSVMEAPVLATDLL
jgi:hypothetical protein